MLGREERHFFEHPFQRFPTTGDCCCVLSLAFGRLGSGRNIISSLLGTFLFIRNKSRRFGSRTPLGDHRLTPYVSLSFPVFQFFALLCFISDILCSCHPNNIAIPFFCVECFKKIHASQQ
ncbi:hypothetical protein CEXT_662631 [Caerostris extrusa]|uniref:Uncharacterized protein n=1 Tax=Caerostris extrusa TaxID=172846 RepID=A0AAV4VCR0_CAEEX|nr:hypothetical protein CEXT_662631 [Caerostris extrusa]